MAQKTRTARPFREELLATIGQVDRPGSFCTWGDLPLVMPGLEVDEVGTIRLPLGKTQVRKIIKQCTQAPYGKGTETVVDTEVRRTWELDPEQFQLTNPHWDELVTQITGQAQAALGLEGRELQAHLYKLLLYEKDGFFLPHQDGEKLDRMVATLVVALPSPHEGGELVVSHEGHRHEIAFAGAASGHELSYAAFYSDCEHEVLPIRSGYRFCLTYNLTLARSRGRQGIAAPRSGAMVATIGKLLRNWPTKDGLQKIAVTLDHQYSQKSLTLDTLKGVDRARADVLLEAAEQADCVAHLALVTHWQSGCAEGGYDDYDYGRGRYRSWSYDEEEEDEEYEQEDGTGYEMGDLIDESLSINHWSDLDGKRVALGEIDLRQEEIVSDLPYEEWDVSREEFEGYTGNAGMTLERWYHRAAVVIWPKQNHFHILCDAGTDAAIAGLQAKVGQLKRLRKAEREQEHNACLEFAEAILKTWSPERYQYYSSFEPYQAPEQVDRSSFLLLLQEMNAPELVCRFLAEVVTQDGEIQIDKTFPKFCKEHGWQVFADALTTIMQTSTAKTISRNAVLLQTLCVVHDKDQDRISLCRRLAELALDGLEQLDAQKPKHDWQAPRIDRAAILSALIKSLLSVDAAKPLSRLVEHTLSEDKKYDLTDVHLKTIFGLEAWLKRKLSRANETVNRWLAHCRTELQQRTAEAPQPPADLRRRSELSCKCSDCRELSLFLDDPHEKVHRFPVRKERRQHLHQVIDGNHCDLTHVTTRTGRPYTLVCTKTTASHKKACQIYARDKENLKQLQAIEKALKKKT